MFQARRMLPVLSVWVIFCVLAASHAHAQGIQKQNKVFGKVDTVVLDGTGTATEFAVMDGDGATTWIHIPEEKQNVHLTDFLYGLWEKGTSVIVWYDDQQSLTGFVLTHR